ncbi:hypothetical protein AB0I28_16960 [Phytomonospora sp. NPDC050363]|uniref:hypothetical protein n=1 Tax=Phytomonospora sp. NPDC050363 TaxID=3155642 RepID=UPI0033E02091
MADLSRVTLRYRQAQAWVERVQPGAIAVRFGVYVTGLLAFTIAAAPVIGWRAAAFGLLLPVMPALRPTKAWSTVLIAISVVVWALAGEQHYALAFLLGALLYIHHVVTAQAVTMRTDTYVTPEVLAGLGRRTGVVLLAAAAASVLAGLLPGLFGRTSAIAYGLAGLAAVVGLCLTLAWLLHRKL